MPGSGLPKPLEAGAEDGVTAHQHHHHGASSIEVISSSSADQQHGLRREITTRQMCFMALSSSIGAGLMVASGQGLAAAGPGSTVLGFAAVGFGVVCTMASLGEMAAALPLSGSFYTYTDRFVGPAAGFAMAWNFCFDWLIVLPFEIITIAAQMRSWAPEHLVPAPALIASFLCFVAVISLLGARWFGEVENWLGIAKALAILTFICLATSLTATGDPYNPSRTVPLPGGRNQHAYGATFWTTPPGAFKDGFRGFLTVFKIAGMAYGGTETLGLTAAECQKPHRLMRIATYVTFLRIFLFYVVSLTMLGFVLPSDTPDLRRDGAATPSPFILAMRLAGLTSVEHLINACIVAALTSMSNVAIFSSSRALHALSCQGMGPRIFARTWKGVPVGPTVLAIGFGLLAFIGTAPGGGVIFEWLLSLAGMSNYFTWLAICASHVRFRAALRAQGRGVSVLSFRSPFGVWGSYVGIGTSVAGLLAQISMAFVARPGRELKPETVAMDVIGVPAIFLLFGGYMVYQHMHGGGWRVLRPLDGIDLDTGFRGKAELAREREENERVAELAELAAAATEALEERDKTEDDDQDVQEVHRSRDSSRVGVATRRATPSPPAA